MLVDVLIFESRVYLQTPRKTVIQIVKHCRRRRQDLTKPSNSNFQPAENTEMASSGSPVGVVPPHLDKNLTDVEKIYAIYDWMVYNERKQDGSHGSQGLHLKFSIEQC